MKLSMRTESKVLDTKVKCYKRRDIWWWESHGSQKTIRQEVTREEQKRLEELSLSPQKDNALSYYNPLHVFLVRFSTHYNVMAKQNPHKSNTKLTTSIYMIQPQPEVYAPKLMLMLINIPDVYTL